ncbi:MZT1 protein, partial [Amia calva]|nr:MZT1 protein [Amia calva]
VLLEISRLLNTGLDMESLSICVRLCEQGINPEALSSVIKELRKASDAFKVRPDIVLYMSRNLLYVTGNSEYNPFLPS